jgi:hypothetical protein
MGEGFVLDVGCHFESLRPHSKPNLHPKSSCLRKVQNSDKRLSFYNKEFQKPKCGPLQR